MSRRTEESLRCDNCNTELLYKLDGVIKTNKPHIQTNLGFIGGFIQGDTVRSLIGDFCTSECLQIKINETRSVTWTKQDKLNAFKKLISDMETEEAEQKKHWEKKDQAAKLRKQAEELDKNE